MGKGTFSCVKWLLTLFNFIFLTCGLAVCGFGVWMFVSPAVAHELFGPNLTPVVAYILLGSGGTITLISFCGCAGAGLENRCLLCLFFTVLCGIFVACLVASILISIFRKDLTTLTNDRLSNNLMDNYGSSEAWTQFWDFVQNKFSCCGVQSEKALSHYSKTKWFKQHSDNKLPKSCCLKDNVGGYSNVNLCQSGNKNAMNVNGCMESIRQMISEQYIVLLAVLITLAVVLIFGMSLSLAHLRNIINIRYQDYSHPI